MPKITLKDIAAQLHTSTKTVSKALNNQPGVSEELRQRIKDIARGFHYIPNPFGKGLSGKPLKTIGVILPDNVNPSYSLILRGLETKAAELQYSIIWGSSNEDLAQENNLVQVLLGKHVDGVVICPAAPDQNTNIDLLQQFGMPYILINRTIPNQNHVCVKTNNVLAAYLAGNYLIEKGHADLLHVTRRDSVVAVEERLEGLQRAFREHGLTFHKKNVYRACDDVSIDSAHKAMRRILAERRDFSAVLTFNDIIAYGVMKAIHEARLNIPADVPVMGFDNLIFSETCLVPLTTVNQHLRTIGHIAMELLVRQLSGRQDMVVSTLPEPYIVERESA